jgi:hypothetical protein
MSKSVETYEDAAARQKRKAVESHIASICKAEDKIKSLRGDLQGCVLDIVNLFIAQGKALQSICGREQITFDFFNGESTRCIQDKLPWGDDSREAFAIAKRRIAIAAAFPTKVTKWDDIAPDARRNLLQQLELLTVSERGLLGDGAADRPQDTLTIFIAHVTRFKQDFLKCVREKPLQERDPEQLRDLFRKTDWVDEVRQQLKTLIDA